ncbi:MULTISPECIES: MFS transporter [unclassified Microbacterium]|uniref:MFS transporter n=1 Tax=unclassified Microbacterium TaxID=2609290 RepID=UPI000EAA1225|nr:MULTISPECIES: MFS transporter [unclassified Microbacterium]MBT2486526.1 MFS transporter [Microbacterium sp. ISL-108]RKN69219.1 MFS transporter [Microbacterium sp. CGR2]
MTTPTPTQNVQTVLDDVGLTRRHWLYFALIFLMLLTDGMDVTIVSHVFPSLIAEWGVTVGGGITIVVTGSFLTMGIGALIAGRLSDRFGRRSMLVASALLLSVATFLGATAADFTAFTAWRILASLGMGAVMPLAITLLADLVPARRRSALIAAAYVGVGLGTTAGAALAGLIIPTGGWRTLMAIAGVAPFVITIALALIVPESPAYYIARGALAKARRVLARVAPGVDTAAIGAISASPITSKRGALRIILTWPFRATTLLLWLFGFFSLGTQLLLVQYMPTLLQQPVPGLTTVESSTIVASYGLASTLSALVLSALLARFPRYATIGSALAASAVVALIVGLQTDADFGTLLPLLTVAGFFLPMAFGPTRNVLAAPTYPASVRGTGVGSTEFAARVGSAAEGAAGGILIGAGLGLSGLFLVALVPIAILGMSLVALTRTTRHLGADGRGGDPEFSEQPPASDAGQTRRTVRAIPR